MVLNIGNRIQNIKYPGDLNIYFRFNHIIDLLKEMNDITRRLCK